MVETKRKRVVVPKPDAAKRLLAALDRRRRCSGDRSKNRPAGISDAELDRRMKALGRCQGARSREDRRSAPPTRKPAPKSASVAGPRLKPRSRKSASAKKKPVPRRKRTSVLQREAEEAKAARRSSAPHRLPANRSDGPQRAAPSKASAPRARERDDRRRPSRRQPRSRLCATMVAVPAS